MTKALILVFLAAIPACLAAIAATPTSPTLPATTAAVHRQAAPLLAPRPSLPAA